MFPAIEIIENEYAREADGWITAAQWFGIVSSMGPPPRLVLPRVPPPGASLPVARVVKGGSGFKAFTQDNFRENLRRLTGGIPAGAHAHHVLPVKFEKQCQAAGINIHEPRFGAWWEASAHLKAKEPYNARWTAFFIRDTPPSMEEILQFGRKIASDYELQIYF